MIEEYKNRIQKILSQYKFHYVKILKHSENLDLLNYISNWDEKIKDVKLGTKIFWVLHDKHDYSYCKYCNKPIMINVSPFADSYPIYCSNYCSNHDPDRNKKIAITNFKRYGCKAPAQNKIVLEKMKKTNNEKYGVDYTWQNEKVKDKIKNTNLEKYGYIYSLQNDEVKQKCIQTCLEKYGVRNGGASKEAIEKIKTTNLERYGVKSSFNRLDVQQKIKQTMLNRYGVEYYSMTEEFKEKTQITNLEKYGTRHSPSWTYIFEGISFDSSWEVIFYIWLRDNNKSFKYHPDIYFSYLDLDGKERKYFPDFEIDGTYYELKSNMFFENHDLTKKMICPFDESKNEIYELKHQCMISNNVVILSNNDMIPYIEYVNRMYGEKYLEQFKNKEWIHCRRKRKNESKKSITNT